MPATDRTVSGYLTAAEVADRLEVHVESVRRWAREGKLDAVTLPSGRRKFRAVDVDRIVTGSAESGAA